MLSFASGMKIFVYTQVTDMRKSFNTLSALVVAMGEDVSDGDVFLFVSRNKKRAKVLWFDGTGLCLLAKRLDQGRFAAIWQRTSDELTMNELGLFLEGCVLVGRQVLSPPALDTERASRMFASDFS